MAVSCISIIRNNYLFKSLMTDTPHIISVSRIITRSVIQLLMFYLFIGIIYALATHSNPGIMRTPFAARMAAWPVHATVHCLR